MKDGAKSRTLTDKFISSSQNTKVEWKGRSFRESDGGSEAGPGEMHERAPDVATELREVIVKDGW